jgi:hypothetical protein
VAAEACRLGAGLAYSTASYFGGLRPPSRWVLDAGRALSPLRLAGLVLAARGRRTAASLLLAGGAVAAVLEVALATRRGWAP